MDTLSSLIGALEYVLSFLAEPTPLWLSLGLFGALWGLRQV
jgi:hypothetical protein